MTQRDKRREIRAQGSATRVIRPVCAYATMSFASAIPIDAGQRRLVDADARTDHWGPTQQSRSHIAGQYSDGFSAGPARA